MIVRVDSAKVAFGRDMQTDWPRHWFAKVFFQPVSPGDFMSVVDALIRSIFRKVVKQVSNVVEKSR